MILVGTHKDKLVGMDEKQKEKHKDDFFDKALECFIDSPVYRKVSCKQTR